MGNTGHVVSSFGLDKNGINSSGTVHWNFGSAQLIETAVLRNEGTLSKDGALVCITGQHTGRSPNDKFIVKDAETETTVDWGKVNVPMTSEHFDALHEKILAHMSAKDLFVQDCYAGADPENRLRVRVVNENAWHNLFARNMFIQPKDDELESFAPDFTVLQAPSCHADPAAHGTNSEVFVVVNFSKKLVIIGGTIYAGEIKKSVFSILNYILPGRGVLPMHCSANIGDDGSTAIFFGLSGTGKTTLSADQSRILIGDDEHGWSDNGVFNFEGGCYAKVINLSEEAEPEIYETTRTFGTILENVVMDPVTRALDLDDGSLTENTRASYPIDFIPNTSETGFGPQPKNIIMLTADAFGVLPPISKLTPEQAMYHFLSGYTAKVAGTEKGVKEPQAAFSTCFGAPFMPRHPTAYAKLLGEKMEKTGATCWLVNTGWSGGGYGVGKRMQIKYTRAMLNAALDGTLDSGDFKPDPNFGLLVPTKCPGVPDDVLQPKSTWQDQGAYDTAAQDVAKRFETNFKQFEEHVDDQVMATAIRAAA
ncbi:MAG: phosphoenolpyruvate carboxykinase [Alphaproteobacteria bacterium]|nr:phosphoenolpyruvate carboxykinase [Alphaproteobacteria bacterium]